MTLPLKLSRNEQNAILFSLWADDINLLSSFIFSRSYAVCHLWVRFITGGKNNTQTHCVLSSSKKFPPMFKINYPTKRTFRIFPILRIDKIALFCNLFTEQPSYDEKNIIYLQYSETSAE